MEHRKLYHIINVGCDAETEMDISLTDYEYRFLRSVFDALNENSEYSCMPRIYVEEKNNEE